jgi:hypothetical protein
MINGCVFDGAWHKLSSAVGAAPPGNFGQILSGLWPSRAFGAIG